MSQQYILGSHNSWTFYRCRKWWQRLFSFVGKCQDLDIFKQYDYGVRCFDLRVRFNSKGEVMVAHGLLEYDFHETDILAMLHALEKKGDVIVRILHETRTKRQYTTETVQYFREFCKNLEMSFPKITFWCGRNLYNWNVDYHFKFEPSCDEKYSSVCKPKWDDWYPKLFAKRYNQEIKAQGTDADILLIDFVEL